MTKAANASFIQPETIYFGGGTPSALSETHLEYLLGRLRDILDLSKLQEWTFEANPTSVRSSKARLLRDLGVTRISLGVQSWNDSLLRTLGRTHSSLQAEKTFHSLRETGFPDINIDLMFSIPGQSLSQWLESLRKTCSLRPEHISSYCLTYEEDTEYFRKLTGGVFTQDENLDADLFELAIEHLEQAGYLQYEISNYALPGHESRHNTAYWMGSDYLGFGPSAFSTVSGSRWANVKSTAAFIQRLSSGLSPVDFVEELSSERRTGEIAAFRLRMSDGMPRSELLRWAREIDEFERLGLIADTGGIIKLSRRGKLLADSVAEIFV